jgi:rhodanese-related sulfurtransferase
MAKTLKELVSEAKQDVKILSVADAAAWTDDTPLVLDVREPEEYRAGHLQGAINLPRGLLEVKVDPASPAFDAQFQDREQSIVTYCTGGIGARSAMAAHTLTQMGFADVAVLDGGLTAWVGAGRPVES